MPSASRRLAPAHLPPPPGARPPSTPEGRSARPRASSRRTGRIGAASAALLVLSGCLAAAPAWAFKVGESPDFKGCYIWFNDAGEALRNRQGREIGRKTPCGEGTHNRDVYEVLFGEAPGTLVIRDATHEFECILQLAPGSSTIMVPKVCQHWDAK